MIKTKAMLYCAICSAMISATGCSIMDPVPTSEANYAQVLPVTQAISLNTDEAHLSRSREEVLKFINELNRSIQNQTVTLTILSPKGTALAALAKQHLIFIGVPEGNIQTIDVSTQYDPLQRFDFSLATTEYKVQAADCGAAKVGHYYDRENGCYIDSARLRSMVNPETMLDQQLLKQNQQ